ncbi:hypothetical protein SD457_10260 [Coprobacillaceae bacterium CR2/5/TPMF4]|nr:hypothetical protein SD457_10260 [Coprobacillaceae bacterium CR2/5/TPMF4]
MVYGKAIELFLVNGTAESLVTAELSNWNGKAIKIPRTEVQQCNRDDLRNAGVYFLFCKEDSDKEKYYWNSAVVFTGRDLNKALIRYLENRSVEIARECGRYQILTKNTYKNTVMKESQIASMEEFIDNVKIIINTLGYKVLEPVSHADEKTVYLYCKGSGANAKGFVSSGGFTVLKGSKVSDHMVSSFELRGDFILI